MAEEFVIQYCCRRQISFPIKYIFVFRTSGTVTQSLCESVNAAFDLNFDRCLTEHPLPAMFSNFHYVRSSDERLKTIDI